LSLQQSYFPFKVSGLPTPVTKSYPALAAKLSFRGLGPEVTLQ